MMSHSALVLCLLLITVSSNLAIAIKKEKRPPQTLSRGWGDDITWVQTYEEGLFHTQKSNKPLMVIHHLEDCQYCQALKKVFAQNKEIQEMAQNNFIMLNLMHETTDKNLSPDGQYVPRIMFVDPSLTVRADITGRYSNRLYTYEPQDLPLLIENMKKALKLIQSEL
ncbi:anterior gradient protein 3 [Moschus berezovskii]|uniref:Anterior gradient 3, protein disulphide isomerase family member n=1 Tax=Moschus moschiferus TaxID=68415 RepID=A0A8C6G3K8_MOSMO|nr:anterior gradient protein 3 [Moschus berezovskii]